MLILGLLVVVAALYAFFMALGLVGTSSGAVRKRIEFIASRPEPTSNGQTVLVEDRETGFGGLITPAVLVQKIERNLLLAGRPEGWTVGRLLIAKPVAAIMATLFAIVVIKGGASGPMKLLLIGAVVLAYFVPDLLVYNRGIKRQLIIERELPDTLDQVTISIEAGLGFEAALNRAGEGGTGPLAEELVRLGQDMRLGMSRRDAYTALGERTTVDDLRRFAKSIVQAEEYGVPISSVVRSQAKEMRIKRRSRAEAKAMQVPVKILLPLMSCILPVLFVVVLGPPITNALRNF